MLEASNKLAASRKSRKDACMWPRGSPRYAGREIPSSYGQFPAVRFLDLSACGRRCRWRPRDGPGRDHYSISQVFGMHNQPGLKIGKFGIFDGPIPPALYEFDIIVKGRGGHAASPNPTIDPIVIVARSSSAYRRWSRATPTRWSRSSPPLPSWAAGRAYNIIPEHYEIAGSRKDTLARAAGLRERQIAEACAGYRVRKSSSGTRASSVSWSIHGRDQSGGRGGTRSRRPASLGIRSSRAWIGGLGLHT